MYQRLQDKVTNRSETLEAEIISLKTDLEKSNKKNEELLQNFEEQENGLKEEILKLNDQVEEGRRVKESMKKKCQRLEVEVNI